MLRQVVQHLFFVSITKRKVNETDNTVGKPYFFVFLQQNV